MTDSSVLCQVTSQTNHPKLNAEANDLQYSSNSSLQVRFEKPCRVFRNLENITSALFKAVCCTICSMFKLKGGGTVHSSYEIKYPVIIFAN